MISVINMHELIEIIKYLVLGIVQGVTEIFPVSSSGHLTIFTNLFRMDPALLTVFLMVTNTGSFLALLFFFRRDVGHLVSGSWRYLVKREETSKEDFFYVLKLLIAVVPVGLAGLLLENHLPSDWLSVGFALLITGSLLFFIYKMRDTQWKTDITWKNALVIGLFQTFAIFPGISRSGITITGGLSEKIELRKVLRFSFLSYILVSVPVSILGFVRAFENSEEIHVLGYTLAFLLSFVFSLLSIRFLYRYVKVKNLVIFAVYCLFAGVFSIIMHFVF
ncbi:MAG: undecaprenyl-diphosphate phosphatase [Acholeplasmataceae bacterium]|nr:MAG: undecaprenyl-diphosphate phosphatase [Acholeplasmataceae bacterium]